MKNVTDVLAAKSVLVAIMEDKWELLSEAQQAVISGMAVALTWVLNEESERNTLRRLMDGERLETMFKVVRWWQGECECANCGHRQQSVIEIDDGSEPVVALECANCGNMTAAPVSAAA